MTPALRIWWAVLSVSAILMFYELWGAKSQDSVQRPQFFMRKRAEADSNRGPSAYQPDALPLGQTGSHIYQPVSIYQLRNSDFFIFLSGQQLVGTTWTAVQLQDPSSGHAESVSRNAQSQIRCTKPDYWMFEQRMSRWRLSPVLDIMTGDRRKNRLGYTPSVQHIPSTISHCPVTRI